MNEATTAAVSLIQKHNDDLLTELKASTATSLDLLKARVAFSEKLIVLNGGTLALSFSAAASFYSKGILSSDCTACLLAAWKCLIFAICAALTAQWLRINIGINLNTHMTGAIVSMRALRMDADLKLIPNAPKVDLGSTTSIEKVTAQSEKGVANGQRVCTVLGLLSQVSTVVAFVWLYKFGCNTLLATVPHH